MKPVVIIAIFILSFSPPAFCQKDKAAVKAEKAVNKDAAKSAREANRAFKDNDYYTAILKAVDALEGELNKKNNKKISEILTESYHLFETASIETISRREQTSTTYEGRNTVSDKYEIMDLYTKLISSQEKLGTLDEASLASMGLKQSSFTDYRPRLQNANTAFLEQATTYCTDQYEKGQSELSEGTKQSAFTAFFHFNEVTTFIPDFKDAMNLKTKAKEDATYKILFVDFGTSFTPPSTSSGTNSIAKNFSVTADKITYNKYVPFVKFMVEGYNNELYLNINNPEGIEAVCKVKQVDAVIFGSYDTPSYSYVDDKPYIRQVEKEVTVGEKKEIRDGKEVIVPIKQKVKATEANYSRTNVSRVNGKMHFYDAYQKKYILNNFGMQGEYYMRQSWTIVSGDERAFSEKEKRFFRKDAEPLPDKGQVQLSSIFELSKIVRTKSFEMLEILYEGN